MPGYRRINVPQWIPCLHSAHQLPANEWPATESHVAEWILWKIFGALFL
jgi:hypothetical protein